VDTISQSRWRGTQQPSRRTSVPRTSKRRQLRDLIAARGWREIGESHWNEIVAAIPNISPTDLQELDIPVAPPWFGVRQHSLDQLQISLDALSDVYATRPDLRRFCRNQVIAAKSKAKFASRNPRVVEIKRQIKAEMAEWMLVWLNDPALFPVWARVRRDVLATSR
jgi:hypothetical protein